MCLYKAILHFTVIFCTDVILMKNIHVFMSTKVMKRSRVKYADRKHVFPVSHGFLCNTSTEKLYGANTRKITF